MHYPTKFNTSKGFTLIELMVGLALSAIVLIGIISVYVPAVKSWGVSADLAELHDTQSIAQETLGINIRQAGLLGCTTDPDNSKVRDGVTPARGSRGAAVEGWAFGQNPAGIVEPSFKAYAANDTAIAAELSASLQAERLDNDGLAGGGTVGDVFFTLTPTQGFYRVENASVSPVGADDGDLTTKTLPLLNNLSSDTVQISEGDFFIINDCDATVVVRADNNSAPGSLSFTNTILNEDPPIVNDDRTVVNPFRPTLFYLGAFRPDSAPADAPMIPALYRRTIQKPLAGGQFAIQDDAILTGVENLRIEYGMFARDALGNPYITEYVTINNTPVGFSMKNVSAIRLSLMIQSAGSNSAAQQTSLEFPDLNGNMVDCYATANPNTDACPEFITSEEGRRKSHKVIQFSYALPRVEDVGSYAIDRNN